MAVRVIHETQVSPSPLLPSQPPQALSFLDSLWLFSSPVERLFFYDYPHSTSHFMNHHLPAFTASLSLTLRHFYPLCGTIRRAPASEDKFEISYFEGDSVPITVAEFTGDDFGNLAGYHPRDIQMVRLLLPKPAISSDGKITPLMVQVTLFPNQGLCVAFAVHHSACDGSGSIRFIRAWAKGDVDEAEAPLLDRSLVRDTRGLQRKLFELTRHYMEHYAEHVQKQSMASSVPRRIVTATFVLRSAEIELLKKRVRARAAGSLHCSAFVVTCAYVWTCLVRARGEGGDKVEYFVFAVDWRSRMSPALPSNYFGNLSGTAMVEIKAGELVAEGGVEVAAMRIGRRIDGLLGEDVSEGIEMVIDKFAEWVKGTPLSVAGSPKLRVYETDFGWGRPVKEVTSIVETGAMSLAESREVDGGMEIGLALSEEEMDGFRTQFGSGL